MTTDGRSALAFAIVAATLCVWSLVGGIFFKSVIGYSGYQLVRWVLLALVGSFAAAAVVDVELCA